MTDSGASPNSPWLLLARILRPQGRKGEVLAELFTDFPDRVAGEPRIFLALPGYAGSASAIRTARVDSFFLPVGRNLGRIVLHLQGLTSIEAAESLAGLEVIVPQDERLEPDDDDVNYISDLLGCTVFNESRVGQLNDAPAPSALVGIVDDIHFPTAPDGLRRLEEAAPILVVLSPAGEEILIPYVKAYLVALDLPARRILMSLPEGLIEVNTPTRQPEPA